MGISRCRLVASLAFVIGSLLVMVARAGECPRDWTPGWTRAGIDGEVDAMTTFDLDGSGPAGRSLILAGDFFAINGVVVKSPVAWDGEQFAPLHAGIDYLLEVHALTTIDLDGSGPLPEELYARGDFYVGSGFYRDGLVRWTRGTGGEPDRWMPIGGPGELDYIVGVAAHDFDGSGPDAPRLVAVTDSNPVNGSVQQWNGAAWTAVGSNNRLTVRGVVSVDHDGDGPNPPVLYLNAGNTGAMRLQGDSWVSVPGLSGTFESVAGFDLDGAGPQGPKLIGVHGRGIRIGNTTAFPVAVAYDGEVWQALGSMSGVYDSPALLTVAPSPIPNAPSSLILILQSSTDQILRWSEGGSGAGGSAGQWQTIAFAPMTAFLAPNSIRGAALFDRDGPAREPAELIVWGSFRFADGGDPLDYLAAARGASWRPLVHFSAVPDGVVLALRAFDPDADGPRQERLFVGGSFPTVRGLAMPALAAWDGREWTSVGTPAASPSASLRVLTMETYDDDGSGPRLPGLYVGGFFNTMDGVPVGHIARLDADGWSALGSGFSSTTSTSTAGVSAMLVVDLDGPGVQRESLLVAGAFDNVDGLPLGRIAAWDGARWTPMGSGAPSAVIGLAAFPRPNTTPQLLAVTSGGSLATWNGAFWQTTPFVFGQRATVARMIDEDGGGPIPPVLLVGGQFQSVAAVPTPQGLARYDGQSWSAVNVTDHYGRTEAAAVLDLDGSGPEAPRLVLAGTFSNRLGNTHSIAIQQGPPGGHGSFELSGGYMYPSDTYAIETFADEPGRPPSLYVAGLAQGVDRFSDSGGLAAAGLARLGCTPCVYFSNQPLGRVFRAGTPLSLSAPPIIDASGATYQWRRNGVFLTDGNGISGATAPALRIATLRTSDAGGYDLLVSASCGSTSSAVAIVSVSCDADFNADGVVGIGDIFAYLPEFLTGHIEADFTRDFRVSVQDLFDFLAAYFVGC